MWWFITTSFWVLMALAFIGGFVGTVVAEQTSNSTQKNTIEDSWEQNNLVEEEEEELH